MDFPAVAPFHLFPSWMFLPDSNLTPIEENIDKIIDGLTKWVPKTSGEDTATLSKITVEGKDYDDTVANMNNMFLRNLWSDGLPILPPTVDRVKWILKGTDLSPDALVGTGKILPRGGKATVEMLAVSLAMAGGRPEYLPILIAATECITNPLFAHEATNATTGACTPVVIVNGLVVKQIRLNRGYSCLGPSSEFPAGASIGRAIRFMLMNLGGGIPGSGSMSIHGGPGRYTGLVFAENEDGLPYGWEPLNVEQGCPRGSNTVTAHVVDLYGEVWEGVAQTEEKIVNNLMDWAEAMTYPLHFPYWNQFRHATGAPGYLLISPMTAQQLFRLGWSKERVKNFLWEHARIPESKRLRKILELELMAGDVTKEDVKYPMPIAKSPNNIKIVVAGGEASTHSYWLRVGQRGASTISEIKLPVDWDQLIEKSVGDLGPIPSTR